MRLLAGGIGLGGLFHRLGASKRLLIIQQFGLNVLQDGGGNFFDRLAGGGQPLHARSAHHGFGLAHFVAAIFEAGVFGAGAALVANFGKALGLNAQAKQLVFVGHQGFGQLLAVKVFGDERVVRHFQPVLHG